MVISLIGDENGRSTWKIERPFNWLASVLSSFRNPPCVIPRQTYSQASAWASLTQSVTTSPVTPVKLRLPRDASFQVCQLRDGFLIKFGASKYVLLTPLKQLGVWYGDPAILHTRDL